jgi:hypothetical protein
MSGRPPAGGGLSRIGLAIGIFAFIAGLIFFVLLYGVFDQVATQIFSLGLETTSDDLQDFQQYVQQAWVFTPLFILLMLAIRQIVRAAFTSRGGV